MPNANVLPDATTTDGALLVLAIVLPAAGVLLSLALGGRRVERIAFVLLPSGLGVAFVILADVWRSGDRLIYIVGDWKPPLGIALRADGLSAAMMATMAIVICAVGVFAHADFGTRAGSAETRAPFAFWILLMAIWGAMNMVFLGGDLFTLYVALEMLTLPRYRWSVSMAAPRHCRPRYDTCCSLSSARFSTWLERHCSTAAMQRSTSSCCLTEFIWSPRHSLLRR